MLLILAMIGDAQASSHVRTALTGYADLVFARDRGELVRALHQQEPDLIVLGIREAADATVSLTVQETIGRFPATRLVLSCRVDGADMRALASLRHLDLSDLVLVQSESISMTRRRLIAPSFAHVADMQVRRLVSHRAPAWIRPFVDWCAGHNGPTRPDVRSLASVGNMRRETFARLCKARGICPPNHLISWILVLRATARMELARCSLAVIARDLGLGSPGSLANLFVRRTKQRPSQIRRLGVAKLAERAVVEMFGQRPVSLPGAVLTATLLDTGNDMIR